jgi:hypothetical protein
VVTYHEAYCVKCGELLGKKCVRIKKFMKFNTFLGVYKRFKKFNMSFAFRFQTRGTSPNRDG